MMLPCTLNAPVKPSALKRMRPALASASLMFITAAVKPAVSTAAPAPTVMPAGLTSTKRPLELSVPKIADGLLVTTRLMDVLAALGC